MSHPETCRHDVCPQCAAEGAASAVGRRWASKLAGYLASWAGPRRSLRYAALLAALEVILAEIQSIADAAEVYESGQEMTESGHQVYESGQQAAE